MIILPILFEYLGGVYSIFVYEVLKQFLWNNFEIELSILTFQWRAKRCSSILFYKFPPERNVKTKKRVRIRNDTYIISRINLMWIPKAKLFNLLSRYVFLICLTQDYAFGTIRVVVGELPYCSDNLHRKPKFAHSNYLVKKILSSWRS